MLAPLLLPETAFPRGFALHSVVFVLLCLAHCCTPLLYRTGRTDVKDVGYVIVSHSPVLLTGLSLTRILRTMTSLTIARTMFTVLVVLGYVSLIPSRLTMLNVTLQRAGSKGVSYTYFTTDNAKQARELVGILREAKANVPPELEEMVMFGGGGGGRGEYLLEFCSLTTLIYGLLRCQRWRTWPRWRWRRKIR